MTRFRSAADQLDQALDDAVTGDSTRLEHHDPATAATWELLADWAAVGGLDGLDPASADSWLQDEDLIHRHERPAIMPHALTMPPPVPASLPLSRSRPTRRSPLSVTWTALTWLLIVAIGGGAIWGLWPLLNDRNPEPTPFAAFQPAATPDANTDTSGVVNWGGDTGHSWVLGDVSPNTFGPEVFPLFQDYPVEVREPGLVIGDLFVFTIRQTDSSASRAPARTVAIDLKTRSLVWQSDAALVGPMASDGKVIAGFVSAGYGRDTQFTDAAPVLLDASTGEIHNTMLPGTSGVVFLTQNNAVTIHAGVAYYANLTSNTLAVDLVTGKVLWEHGTSGMQGLNNAPRLVEQGTHASLVVSDDGVFALSASFEITRFDASTGEETGRFNLVDDHLMRFESATIQAVANKLVITARTGEPGLDESWVFVYGTESLGFFTKSRLERLQSNLVVTLTDIYAVGALDPTSPGRLISMNPVTGDSAYLQFEVLPFFESDARIGLSLAGNTLMTSGPEGRYAFIHINDGMLLQSHDAPIPTIDSALVTDAPPLLWGQNVLLLARNGDIHMLTDNTPETSDQA